jgi:hypothetical protein
MSERKVFTKDDLFKSLDEISNHIEKPIRCYLIGGLAMILQGAKAVTKDIDIIFQDIDSAQHFIESLQKCDFTEQTDLPDEYLQLNTTYVFKNIKDHQFDIFVNQVCNGLFITEEMISKSVKVYDNGNLKIFALSLNHIFLFKGITERPHDLDDMFTIAGKIIDWKEIEDELRSQPESWKWLCQYHGRLIELNEKFKLESPSIKRLQGEADESRAMSSIMSILQFGSKSVQEILSAESPDEKEYLEKTIQKLIAKGLVIQDGDQLSIDLQVI